MNITLNGPVTLTLAPETVALILDTLSNNVSYSRAKPIIEGEIIPQLTKSEGTKDDSARVATAPTPSADPDFGSSSGSGGDSK